MPSLQQILDETRSELLDLSTRNRLLSMPVETKSARVVHVWDEKSDPVFRLLVGEKKSFSLIPRIDRQPRNPSKNVAVDTETDLDEDNASLPLPDENEESGGISHRHDTKLQTSLSSDGLQKRLLSLYRDARSIIEEQGVNVLYLALGRLKWFETEKSDTPRYAPLILVPVELKRKSASERFTLTWREEDVQENLSLAAKLRAEFGIELPKFPSEDELIPSSYAKAVSGTLAGQERWEVQADAMLLGFFSFAKFLMYRDLDPRSWPAPDLLLTPTLENLLCDGFPATDSPFPSNGHLDEIIPASRLDHVVDADGSQTIAIEMVRAGRSLVIQGPPGTGKSQSITNLIATAVLDGKKVLFVAEKLAALQVVKRRLEAAGLGSVCLELHSHKAHKRAVLEEIGRTWQLGRPRGEELEVVISQLEQSRARLNGHVAMLHAPIGAAGTTPFRIFGSLALLGERGRDFVEPDFSGAENWDENALRERRGIIAELVKRIDQMGAPSSHPWRGAEREVILNIDLPPIRQKLERLSKALPPLLEAAKELASFLCQPEPSTFSEIEILRRMANHLASAPALDPSVLGHEIWDTGIELVRVIVNHGHEATVLRQNLASIVTDAAFESDFSSARASIAAHGQSIFRFVNGDFRQAMSTLRGITRSEPPKSHAERVALLDDVALVRKHLMGIRAGAEMGKQAFGSLWKGEDSAWDQLSSIIEWISTGESQFFVSSEFRRKFLEIDRSKNFGSLSDALELLIGEAWQCSEAVKDEVALNLSTAFGIERLEDISIESLSCRLGQWLETLEDLTRWNTWFTRAVRARQLGLGSLVDSLENASLSHNSAADIFDRAFFSRLLREAVKTHPELAQFDGLEHERVIEDFRRADLERLTLAKYRVLAKHYEGIPARHAGAGATGILLGELERKRGHRPVRKLLKDAGSVVQAIKPVFMMSPLSVAQYLEPGSVHFDLLVIDEASQVQPVDALGAFARATQHVVVGDSKQLPPTRFFSRLTSNEDDEEDLSDEESPSAAQAKDVESILGLCCARGLPETMLRWHYRSRHHSLIAVSNREFYEDKLFIVPSPHTASAGLGLEFQFVKGGIYDRGGSSTNRVEARAVCKAILEHARHNPKLSLGVAAFSIKQQQAIEDELELLRREQPDVENFFQSHPHEPFFVKNLENLQGDERDVIFISVGYGPDSSGYLAMNFGPLSNEGGERRLNVLISRAKRRCVVFASLRADDIDLARVTGRGVRSFKTFLKFAETGILTAPAESVGKEMSPFEEAVRRSVEALGYEVHPQVGVAGFFVDLGVVDPEKPGRYILGIECDGAAYHSSRSARDRDRLRQAVLEDHGWIIHRIWSTDWFQRPGEQLRKVVAAIEKAKLSLLESSPIFHKTEDEEEEIERDIAVKTDSLLSVPYIEAAFNVPHRTPPQELSPYKMAEVIFKILEIESPIHQEELTVRVRDLWGLGRAGSRIQDSVADGIRTLVLSQRCQREEDCLLLPGTIVPVRNREVARSNSLRKPNFLPPQEIRAAIEKVISEHHGAGEIEITQTVARLLGFKTTSSTLRLVIQTQIKHLCDTGKIIAQDGLLRVRTTN